MGFFQKIAAAISGFFTKEVPVVEDAFTKAEGFVNVVKNIEGSVPGQMVQSLVDLVFPGIGPAIFTGLNAVLNDFGIVDKAVTGIASDIAAQGLTAINKLGGDSRTLALSNVASIIGHVASTANGGGSTLQQAIVSLPIVHNNNVLSTTSISTTPEPPQAVAPAEPNVPLGVDPNVQPQA